MNETILFTTTMCHKCPEAKKYLENEKIKYKLITIDKEPEAMILAQQYGIMTVPTILENNKTYDLQEYKNERKKL